ncbi:MAG: ImmA/IrrE family metallo-endopeptidase [Deltaproteobacteria bacterium]|nr:ImmA/IrrE family metallo-endopeptidase [Deltaproteobacteria bacterium]
MSATVARSLGASLRARREALNLDLSSLAVATGLGEHRLAALEAGREEPAVGELRELSRYLFADLVGFDPEEEPEPRPRPQVRTLLRAAERVLPPRTWPAVVEAAEVASAVVELEGWRGLPSRWDRLRRRFAPDARVGDPAWRDGERLAELVRRELKLGDQAIPSMFTLCEALGVAIIETWLPEQVSALCLADASHGPAVVLNRAGRNEDPLVRRFSLAHELCHVLFDRHELNGIQDFDRYPTFRDLRDKPPVEQRADAFSAHLLAPTGAFRACWGASLEDDRGRVAAMSRAFGLSYVAAWYHTITARCLPTGSAPGSGEFRCDARECFAAAERAVTDNSLFEDVSLVRRGPLLQHTLRALEEGVITRSRALELLDLEGEVLDAHHSTWLAALPSDPPKGP